MHIFVSLQAFSDEANELLPIFNKTSSKFYKTSTVPTGDWSVNQVKYKKNTIHHTNHSTNNSNNNNNGSTEKTTEAQINAN